MNIVSNGGSGHNNPTSAAAMSAASVVDPAAVAALQDDVAELKSRLAARDRFVCLPLFDGKFFSSLPQHPIMKGFTKECTD